MSGLELSEVRQILDEAEKRKGRERTTEEDLQNALQALFMHQCVYSDAPLSGRPYDIICRHRTFFEKFASAIGYELVVDRRDGLAALCSRGPGYGWRENRLKKDETLVMLALRYLFEDGTRRGEMSEQGRVESSTDEIYDAIKTLARTEPPSEARLIEILKFARRKGLVRIEDRDRLEKVWPIVVLPGIRVLVPDVHVEAVIHWIENGAVDAYADFFDYLTGRLSGTGGAEPSETPESGDEEDGLTEGDPLDDGIAADEEERD